MLWSGILHSNISFSKFYSFWNLAVWEGFTDSNSFQKLYWLPRSRKRKSCKNTTSAIFDTLFWSDTICLDQISDPSLTPEQQHNILVGVPDAFGAQMSHLGWGVGGGLISAQSWCAAGAQCWLYATPPRLRGKQALQLAERCGLSFIKSSFLLFALDRAHLLMELVHGTNQSCWTGRRGKLRDSFRAAHAPLLEQSFSISSVFIRGWVSKMWR